ncbi:MAG TPA: hypothetical protein VFS63_00970 [Pseudolabrys sp.]|nr:hypothetical protein [Pseudolabrys sp.]
MLHTIVLRALRIERCVALFEMMRSDFTLKATLKDTATAVKGHRYGRGL